MLLLWPLAVEADMYTISRQGGTIVPSHSAEVSMDAETVVIKQDEYDYYQVTATFLMRNQSRGQVVREVAFPVLGSDHASYRDELDINQVFKVRMKTGTALNSSFSVVPIDLIVNKKLHQSQTTMSFTDAKQGILDYPECVVWKCEWAPGEVKTIEVSYEMGKAAHLPWSNEIANGRQLLYVVRTGALWKGPIGKADIIIYFNDFNYNRPQMISYPDQAKWNEKKTLYWHFENWVPNDDIWAKFVNWEGVATVDTHYLFLGLSSPYTADKVAYSIDMIEQAAEDKLRFAKEYFPDKANKFDRKPLKKVVAEWLYYEIFARHGDAFVLGKHKRGQPEPPDALGYDPESNYYTSKWQWRFMPYHYHGGWYEPDENRRVHVSDLNPMEQKNAAFLKAYITQLCGAKAGAELLHAEELPAK